MKNNDLRKNRPKRISRKLPQIAAKEDRAAFWKYCVQTAFAARARANAQGVPYLITAYDIDELLVRQEWRCALSGLPLSTPKGDKGGMHRDPLGPSIDRIIPRLGYVPSNIRITCMMVNMAMNEWGIEALMLLFDAIVAHRERGYL